MTPMIDVVFLLIIFFLVSSHMAKQENRVALDLPKAASGLSDTVERHSLVINVLADGTWKAGTRIVDATSLPGLLRQRQQASSEPLQLKIRTDARVPYKQLEPILFIASQLGIGDIAFAVIEERRK